MVRLARSRDLRYRYSRVAGAIALVVAALATVVAGATGPAAAATPTLDHFECYSAEVTTSPLLTTPSFPATPSAVMLQNSFAPAGFLAATTPIDMHCNPVEKILPTGAVTPVTNPNAHLLCWGVKPNKVTLPKLVTFTNQFGTGAMKPTAVQSLCLPSWKSLNSPANLPTAPKAPPGLDHFTCYTVTVPAGVAVFTPPATLTLTDQFQTTQVTRIGPPNKLCLPTAKTIDPAVGPTKVVNPTHSLVCFPIVPGTKFVPMTVFEKNQFGVGAVKVIANKELCVPSTTPGGVG